MIVLINPNATAEMTETMLGGMRAVAPDLAIEGWTSFDGPPAIQGVEDGEAARVPLLKLVEQAAARGAQAIVIGCFDDTALAEARAVVACPVIGIGQAAYHLAALSGARFSVVTTLAVSVPILEANIRSYHLEPYLSRVRASGVPVLDLEHDPGRAAVRVLGEVQRAEAEDGIDTVVLGCAGMVDLPDLVRAETGLRAIDGVRAAAVMLRGLI